MTVDTQITSKIKFVLQASYRTAERSHLCSRRSQNSSSRVSDGPRFSPLAIGLVVSHADVAEVNPPPLVRDRHFFDSNRIPRRDLECSRLAGEILRRKIERRDLPYTTSLTVLRRKPLALVDNRPNSCETQSNMRHYHFEAIWWSPERPIFPDVSGDCCKPEAKWHGK